MARRKRLPAPSGRATSRERGEPGAEQETEEKLYTQADLKEFEETFPDIGDVVFEALRGKVLENESKEAPAASPDAGASPADKPAPTPTRGARELAAEVGLDLRLVTHPTGHPDSKGRPKATQKDVERVLGIS